MKWAMELAPPMPAQLVATLGGLAYHADSHGRGAYPSVARLAAYTCKDKRSVQRDIRKLVELEFIRLGDQSKAAHLPEGKRPEVYDLAVERTVPGGRAGDAEVTRTSRVALASSRRRGGKKKPSSDTTSTPERGDVGATPDVDATRDVDVANGVTWASQEGWRGRHPNQLPEPTTETTTSLAPHGDETDHSPASSSKAASSSAKNGQQKEHHLEAFGAFWLTYPKKKAREEAKKAWIAAIERGAQPEHMVQAAQAYARERAGEESKYTKYPATWLNKGCYDDEPDQPPTGSRPGHLRSVGPQTAPRDIPDEELPDVLSFG